jgi:hypothetical protein
VESLNQGMSSKMDSMKTQMKDVNKKLTELDTNFELRVKSVSDDVGQVKNDMAKVRMDLASI